MAHRALARGDTKHPNTVTGDNFLNEDSSIVTFSILNDEGFLVDPQRVLTHPGFAAVEGQGIFTYTHNPDETRNFILAPAKKVDTNIQRTLGSSVVIQQSQVDEDIVITEVWTATGPKLSVLAEMYRTFHTFWTTLPDPGEYLTWEPKDLSVESFDVLMVNVTLGGPDIVYREFREVVGTRDGAYLAQQLIVQMKIVEPIVAPEGVVTLVGL